jgi:hypothetical protein
MYGFASYDIVRARQTLAEERAAQVARLADAASAPRRGRTLTMRLALTFRSAPAARPSCCAV